jgi:hypothetical protein
MSLASRDELGTTIIIARVFISLTEAIRQGDTPDMQHSSLLLRSMEQENKQTNQQTSNQTVIQIVASLTPCMAKEPGKRTTVA